MSSLGVLIVKILGMIYCNTLIYRYLPLKPMINEIKVHIKKKKWNLFDKFTVRRDSHHVLPLTWRQCHCFCFFFFQTSTTNSVMPISCWSPQSILGNGGNQPVNTRWRKPGLNWTGRRQNLQNCVFRESEDALLDSLSHHTSQVWLRHYPQCNSDRRRSPWLLS